MTFLQAPRAIVVDASVAVDVVGHVGDWPVRMEGWVTEDALLVAPSQFRMEVANAMLVSQRQPLPAVQTRLGALLALGIEVSDGPSEEIVDCSRLADQHGLTVYDAAYLHLALELEAELATQDRALAAAARAEGLVVHD